MLVMRVRGADIERWLPSGILTPAIAQAQICPDPVSLAISPNLLARGALDEGVGDKHLEDVRLVEDVVLHVTDDRVCIESSAT